MDPTSRRSAASPHPSSNSQQQGSGAGSLPHDDEMAAKVVIATKTHYEALFLSRTCTDSEIKLSYRKLALRFHPDRCKANSAEEAFKTISAAYGTLMDTKLRQNYDVQLQYGRTPNPFASTTSSTQPRQQQGAGGVFRFQAGGDDMTAEDLFNMFFFNQAPQFRQQQNPNRTQHQQNQTQTQNRRRGHPDSEDNGWQNFVHYVPLLVMLLFTFLSLLPSQDPPVFSMEKHGRYAIPYTTPNIKIPFYVTTEAHNTILREQQLEPSRQRVDLGRIQREVEDEYVQGWQEKCTSALARKQRNSSEICTQWTNYSNELKTKREVAAKEKRQEQKK